MDFVNINAINLVKLNLHNGHRIHRNRVLDHLDDVSATLLSADKDIVIIGDYKMKCPAFSFQQRVQGFAGRKRITDPVANEAGRAPYGSYFEH
jgi:hypothetical protein